MRAAITEQLTTIAKTSQLVARTVPVATDAFQLPTRQSDAALLTAAHAFIQESQPRADSFAALGLPATFVTELSALVDRYEQTIRGRRDGESRRDGAKAGLRTAIAKGLDAARALDIIVGNTLKHDPARANSYTFMGYTIGRWEGDTLVLDSIGFTDETWLARGGWIHSDQMRVIEKFTRTGNQMLYEVTVEDPVMFIKPWVMPPITMRNTGGNTIINERGACSETELEQVSSQERH